MTHVQTSNYSGCQARVICILTTCSELSKCKNIFDNIFTFIYVIMQIYTALLTESSVLNFKVFYQLLSCVHD